MIAPNAKPNFVRHVAKTATGYKDLSIVFDPTPPPLAGPSEGTPESSARSHRGTFSHKLGNFRSK